jgi:hypothetical protein
MKAIITYSNIRNISHIGLGVMDMVFNATFNNIPVISWRSVLFTDLPQITDILYHIMLYRIHLVLASVQLTTLVVLCPDCIGSYKSNSH